MTKIFTTLRKYGIIPRESAGLRRRKELAIDDFHRACRVADLVAQDCYSEKVARKVERWMMSSA